MTDPTGSLRAAMESLTAAQSSGEGVAAAAEQLGDAIEAVTEALNVPTPLAADEVAAHNAFVNEVNAAVDRFNQVAEALNATGAWCQFCGLVIEDGSKAVPTASIPEENIQMYAHGTCHAMVMADAGSEVAR